jgi:putative endonuclease
MFILCQTEKIGTIYTGMTNNLERRISEHKKKEIDGFTKKYNLTKLIYYEDSNSTLSAIELERQIKGWLRSKKIKLIEEMNPEWKDLSEE